MIEAWRIVKSGHVRNAFDGEGARLYGGRWNHRGFNAVYTSGSLSLAYLETIVHLHNMNFKAKFSRILVSIPEKAIRYFDPLKLPANWRAEPPVKATKTIGSEWIQQARSAVLGVPSVIVENEFNYIINPAHPDFKKLKIGKPEPHNFDGRLIRVGKG